ncbi:MAG: TonB-dependent receptor [Bacteroidia bacterium]
MKTIQILFLLLLLHCGLTAQPLTQVVRGTVTDKISQTPLPGVVVILVGSEPLKGATTDENGIFRLTGVPVGKQTLRFSFIGYEELVVPNLDVTSGKELVIQVNMDEKIVMSKEAVITAEKEKNKPMNEMALVSARTFSVEETQKYAAAVNDPARMATAFAGVVSTDDGNNNISIRGNAPYTLQWRMEGVEIPNPNHFSAPGTSGGGISILSSQLLYNSDFLTGAFPAEYGNALSGIFDLRLRKGNNEKREFTLQTGFLGIDLAAEGPFAKNYGGSYLINYRYSTLAAIQKMVSIGDAMTLFQDLSFNVYLPTKRYGNFGLFGFGGLSSSKYDAKKDSLVWEDEGGRYSDHFQTLTSAAGITHTYLAGQNTYIKSVFALSTKNASDETYRLDNELKDEKRFDGIAKESKATLSTILTHKINSRHSFRTGVIVNQLGYKIDYLDYDNSTRQLVQTIDASGTAMLTQAFAGYTFRINEKFTANAGFHYLYFHYNNTSSPEERASLRYNMTEKQSLTFGYGRHGQIQPIGVYFAEMKDSTGVVTHPNKDLGFTKSQHYVLSYDRMLGNHTHVKAELYYQQLNNIPISTQAGNTFSMVNQQFDYITDPLINKGEGINKGIELTLEQYLYKDFYYLLSASVYDASYKANDNKWRNTRYNGGYNFTFTSGKEFKTGPRFKNRVIGVNIKVMYSGGQRQSPVDVEASRDLGETVYDNNNAFTVQQPDYFRTDLRFSMKRNRPNSTHTLSLDLQNATNHKNIWAQFYDPLTDKVKTFYQTPLIPVLSYKIEF